MPLPCQRSGDVIVIDSDDDRKPAAKPAAPAPPPGAARPCISLLDGSSSDEDGIGGFGGGDFPGRRACSKRKGPSAISRDSDREGIGGRAQTMRDERSRTGDSARRREEAAMAASSEGKAVLAVQEIMALVRAARERFIDGNPRLGRYRLEAVTVDDMVYFATRMLDLQGEFVSGGANGYIDTGYHYTDLRNLSNIRNHGLMTAAERQSSSVRATGKGAMFGDGIYTANNGTMFRSFGDTGLIVGRLQGRAVRAAGSMWFGGGGASVDANTIVGDKRACAIALGGPSLGPRASGFGGGSGNQSWPADDSEHEIVLRSSRQCLPVVCFDNALRNCREGKDCVRFIRWSLQQIFDRLFNEGLERADVEDLPMVRASRATFSGIGTGGAGAMFKFSQMLASSLGPAPFPGPGRQLSSYSTSASNALMPMMMPSLHNRSAQPASQTLSYNAPRTLGTGVPPSALAAPPACANMEEECAICFDAFKKRKCVALRACNHVFHGDCIEQAFGAKPQCPVCRKSIGEPRGKSPSGQMIISKSPIKCSGYRESSIVITYSIPAARQMGYHDNPGLMHGAKHETAYLPDNADGRNLCKRLKYAFIHGLTFTVGTSMTSGAPNQCTVSRCMEWISP